MPADAPADTGSGMAELPTQFGFDVPARGDSDSDVTGSEAALNAEACLRVATSALGVTHALDSGPEADGRPEPQDVCEALRLIASGWADLSSAVQVLPSAWQLPSATAAAVVHVCEQHIAWLDRIGSAPVTMPDNLPRNGEEAQRGLADSLVLSEAAGLQQILAQATEELRAE